MYIAIEGVIGVGKTTLVRLLQNNFEANIQLEIFEENPFLGDFYTDRARYAFQTQIFFLLSRYQQQHQNIPSLLKTGKNLLTDYTFEKDALFASINLFNGELDMYKRVHQALAEKIPLPDLTVYLRADSRTLMERIALRDRPYERMMDQGYISELVQAYDRFFHTQKSAGFRSLIIETDAMDYVRHPEDLGWIENRIRQTLAMPPFQPELPLNEIIAAVT
jgi:deoxyguanosine kinase